ncbi:TerD family protein [Nocardioides sp. CN2-186]|uniref:TerD family protein n=1 Tax=Nocardioides tweenelious TaxID=3156607 RepID=UPI0032B4D6CE
MIELTKGQELPLTTVGRVRMAVGWDKERNAGFLGTGNPEVDLDATAVQFTGRTAFDFAFYNNLATRDGSVVHQGDNKTGSGEGDDEVIAVDLAKVYAKVDTIVFLVSSYQGHSLEWVNKAYCRLVDDQDVELARLTLTAGVPETGAVMAKLVRTGDGWTLRAIGEGIAVTVPTKSVDALLPYV